MLWAELAEGETGEPARRPAFALFRPSHKIAMSMQFKPKKYLLALILCLSLISSSCYGRFHLTNDIYEWNSEISDDAWVTESVFVVLIVIPVYPLAMVMDSIVLNSVEFWTSPRYPEPEGEAPARRKVDDDEEDDQDEDDE